MQIIKTLLVAALAVANVASVAVPEIAELELVVRDVDTTETIDATQAPASLGRCLCTYLKSANTRLT